MKRGELAVTDKRANEKTVVQEVERAELAQVDGGSDDGLPPFCGTHRSIPNPWPWSPRLIGHCPETT